MSIQAGDHIGAVFADGDEFVATTLSLAEQGLREHARVLVLPDPGLVETVRLRLAEHGGAMRSALSEHRLQVLDVRRAQLRTGCFDPERLRAMYASAAGRSVADGFSGLWISVDMGWARPGVVDSAALAAFEAGTNTLFTGRRLTAVCQYGTRTFSPAEITRVRRAHPADLNGARFRHRLAGDGRGLALSGDADWSNQTAWEALTASLPDGDAFIDITGMTFMGVRAMAQLGQVAAARPHGMAIVATPGQSAYLRLIGVDRVAVLVSAREEAHETGLSRS
ncbi:MEDS domain-containing protein [Planomonospora venezuelensis]|uniref:MEDS domain-containing protein n=1 Tax=Planomonospora venezuelensis TaxID=1999 RepID=A0A841DC41_PLAVE|nr:MEDS domain-containing protein [Planomonospora venezuelensis]MBB5966373.1 hypothetical protein [Planomonospora venezuelensis]